MRVTLLSLLFLLLLPLPPAAYAQGIRTCGMGRCYHINATYNSYVVRRGETAIITIPAADVLPPSRGTMVLFVPSTCTLNPVFGVVAAGNVATWTVAIPHNVAVDPCVVTLGAEIPTCYGACDPLPAWAQNDGGMFATYDLTTSLVRIMNIGLVQWALALLVGGTLGAIVFTRIRESLAAYTDEGAERDGRQDERRGARRVDDEERGEWSDERSS